MLLTCCAASLLNVIAAFIGVLVSFIHFSSAIIAAVIAFAVAFAFGIYKEVKYAKVGRSRFSLSLSFELDKKRATAAQSVALNRII